MTESFKSKYSHTLCLYIILSSFIPLPSALAQPTQDTTRAIQIGKDSWISLDHASKPLVEPHLADNPKNPDHLLAGVMVYHSTNWSEEYAVTCATYVSFDGGLTWDSHDFPIKDCADPWVAITSEGVALFTALGAAEGMKDGLLVYRSEDGGRTWPEEPRWMGSAHDHQTLAIDFSDSLFAGSLYLVSGQGKRTEAGKRRATVYVARSSDEGKTFHAPVNIIPSNLNLEAQNPVVLSDGTLLVPFQDHRTLDRKRLERRRSWILASTDGGATFSEPLFVTEACTRSRPAAWPSLAVDRSKGLFQDRLYLVCERQEFDGIQIHVSEDRAETWSAPIRIDQNNASGAYTKTPTIAVNDKGVVALAWYDGRHHSDNQCADIYITASFDGGETFLSEVKVSDESSCPHTSQNGDVAPRFPAGGEYFGFVARADGTFHLVWADSRTGVYQLRSAMVKVNGEAKGNG